MNDLGWGYTDQTAPIQIAGDDPTQGTSELVLPGVGDVAIGLNMFRADSNDINMYKVMLATPGTLSAETIAQRLNDPSTLNTQLRVFQQNADGSYSPIAQNDDYFGQDSFTSLSLPTGTYFIGVTASGNDQYDPSHPDSGMNGKTTGGYELRVNFTPRQTLGPAQATERRQHRPDRCGHQCQRWRHRFQRGLLRRADDDRRDQRLQSGDAEREDVHRLPRGGLLHLPIRRPVESA